jgi:hypothetical protein
VSRLKRSRLFAIPDQYTTESLRDVLGHVSADTASHRLLSYVQVETVLGDFIGAQRLYLARCHVAVETFGKRDELESRDVSMPPSMELTPTYIWSAGRWGVAELNGTVRSNGAGDQAVITAGTAAPGRLDVACMIPLVDYIRVRAELQSRRSAEEGLGLVGVVVFEVGHAGFEAAVSMSVGVVLVNPTALRIVSGVAILLLAC